MQSDGSINELSITKESEEVINCVYSVGNKRGQQAKIVLR